MISGRGTGKDGDVMSRFPKRENVAYGKLLMEKKAVKNESSPNLTGQTYFY
jgi:hypothetical protein